ncbi:MAG: hypothetical protein ACR2FS_05005 [Phormidesmis sp.]
MSPATATLTDVYKELDWNEIIPGHYQADCKGYCLEVEIGFRDNWTAYDPSGDVWLEGSCSGLPDGKVKAFNALKAEIS